MSISAISGSSAYSTAYASSSSTKKSSSQDPMTQAISNLQTTDPTLASKLSDMQKKVDTMKKSGASEKDVQSTIKSTMDGLSATEKGELQSAMPAPPAGGKGGHHGGHSGPPPSSGSSDSTGTSSKSDVAGFSLVSALDSSSSMQNDSIMGMLQSRMSVM